VTASDDEDDDTEKPPDIERPSDIKIHEEA